VTQGISTVQPSPRSTNRCIARAARCSATRAVVTNGAVEVSAEPKTHTESVRKNNTCGWSHQPVGRRARRHRLTIARERIRQGRGVVASPSVQVSTGEHIWSTPSSEPHTPRTNARTTCVITVSRRRTATPCDTGDDGTGNRKAVRPSFHKDDLTNQCKTPSLLVPERRWRQSARRAPTPNWR